MSLFKKQPRLHGNLPNHGMVVFENIGFTFMERSSYDV
jgi:hypothetical protein